MEGLEFAADYSLARYAGEADAAVVGPRDSRVQEINTTRFPWNTVTYLCRDYGNNACAGCSGLLIAPNTVLTAAHCIWSLKRQAAPRSIRVMPGRRSRNEVPYGSIRSTRYYVPRAFLESPQRVLFDWAVIILPHPFPELRRFVPLHAATDQQLANLAAFKRVTVAGYPSDRPLGTMWRHSEQVRKVTRQRLFYTVDTCPGHSGSAILVTTARGWRVIGVHTAGLLDERGQTFGCRRGTILAPAGSLNSGIRLTPDIIAAVNDPEAARTGPLRLLRLPR
ncbi:MAG: trypsin-like serine protease [Rhodospirillales bacterium]|nr:trypsin-like serine protease [Rhodospirillales bacterium]